MPNPPGRRSTTSGPNPGTTATPAERPAQTGTRPRTARSTSAERVARNIFPTDRETRQTAARTAASVPLPSDDPDLDRNCLIPTTSAFSQSQESTLRSMQSTDLFSRTQDTSLPTTQSTDPYGHLQSAPDAESQRLDRLGLSDEFIALGSQTTGTDLPSSVPSA